MIKYISLSKIKPFAKNNKRHPARQIEMIANSIKEFGFQNPIIVDKNNEIIAWHGRYLAAQQLWLETAPCIVADNLTPKQVRAYRLLDNRIGDFAQYDIESIISELSDIWDMQLWLETLDNLFDSLINTDEESDDNGKDGELSDKYTKKIEAPIYIPSGVQYTISEIYDKAKYETFVNKINGYKIDDELKQFLILSATRHIEFNFEKIANYYANLESKEVKELFEDLALVIIDYNKAIENWYIQLSKAILDLATTDE